MRKPMMVANWKMNKDRDEALHFIFAVNQELPKAEFVETVICAQSILLRCLVKRQGEELKIGAQNMHFSESGPYTGELSPKLLNQTGVEYALVGHSERRQMYNENDESVNKKVHCALANDITPIICVGETLEEREANKLETVLVKQIKAAYKNVDALDVSKTVIAYEPVWAIGTGKTATPQMAEEACLFVRDIIKKLYRASIAEDIRVLYGGSVNPNNVSELMEKPNIDGSLVGGASLDADSFIALAKACVK